MSTAVAVAPQRDGLHNLGVYLRFTARRNWVRFLVWFLIIVGMLWFIVYYYQQLFKDPKELQVFVDTARSPSLGSMVGLLSNPASIGGAVWSKYWMFGSLMLSIGVLFLMTRNLRADEDQGRAELVRSYPLGIHSRLASSVILMSALSVVIGVLSGLIVAASGVTDAADAATGSWILGLSMGAMGLLGVGVGALVNETSPSSAAANGTGVAVIGVFYVIRMIGDLQADWLVYVSPLGWGEKMDPWGANRWWLLLPIVGLYAVLCLAAWALQTRRDLGDSLARARTGADHASGLTRQVWGLGLRLQRGSIIGWAVGLIVFGGLLGSVMKAMQELLAGATNMPGLAGVGAGLDATLGGLLIPLMALAVGVFAAQSSTTLRTDEAHGVLESQVAGGIGRVSWALQRLAVTAVTAVVFLVVVGLIMGSSYASLVSDSSKVGVGVGAMLVYLPSCLLLASIFVLGFGWWPRFAVTVTWIVVGSLWVFMIIGMALNIPQWVLDLMPFNAIPKIPAVEMDWRPVLVISAITVACTVVGLIGFRRRNIPT